jgi:hypothetical protein
MVDRDRGSAFLQAIKIGRDIEGDRVAITGWWGKDRGGKCPFHGRSLDFWVFWSLGCVIADIYISICSCFPSRLQTTKNIKEMYGICFYFLFFRIPHLFVLSKTKEVVIDERIKLF